MGLRKYHSKRDFRITREPKGAKKSKQNKKEAVRSFVIQEHHARRLHWDFRLEFDGVLKSWAVPKGPSLDPNDKRLAVEVEDHPISYGSFEGEIPKGEYGAGKVKIWDKGTWEAPKNTRAALKKGHLDFILHGEKLNGTWTLIRLKKSDRGKNNWLLFKRLDQFSINPRAKLETTKKKTRLPTFVKPQLAQLVDRVPVGAEWFYEIKFDGYRTFCRIESGKIKFLTRSGKNWTDVYSTLKKFAEKIDVKNALIDGEIVWVDESGRSDFQLLQNALSEGKTEGIAYYVFDLLFLNGEDLRERPLYERKELLNQLVRPLRNSPILFSEHWKDHGEGLYLKSCELGLEGILSKDSNAGYFSGRSGVWQKTKCSLRQEFVIGGFTESPAKHRPFGALLLGVYVDKNLVYVGRVGTGFSSQTFKDLESKLKKLETSTSSFIKSPHERDIRWTKPQLVAEIEFKTWTSDNLLRQASFQGLRSDKKAADIHIDVPKIKIDHPLENVKISHPDRIVYRKTKTSKMDVVTYYNDVCGLILPFLKDRPVSLLRCQSHSLGDCYFQKHSDGRNLLGVTDKPVHYKDKKDTAISVDSKTALIKIIQAGTVEIHTWNALFSQITTPDQIVFDLDPETPKEWDLVVETAYLIREMLESLGLMSFVKVTGGKGIHIHVPIVPNYSWDEIKIFAKSLMMILESQMPARYTTNMSKSVRKQKIFLDYLRNGYGATAVVPYSLRARKEPTVALPISWKDLRSIHAADEFIFPDVLKLIKRRRDPWRDYWNIKQKIKTLEGLNSKGWAA